MIRKHDFIKRRKLSDTPSYRLEVTLIRPVA